MIRKLLLSILLLTLLTSCGVKAIFIPSNPQEEACRYEYCRVSEGDVKKAIALRLVELGANTYNIKLELSEGVCTELYIKRDIDYRYAFKSAKQICNGE